MVQGARFPLLQRGTRLERKAAGPASTEGRSPLTIRVIRPPGPRRSISPSTRRAARSRALAGGIGRRHRRRIVEQHDEVLTHAGRRQAGAAKDEREGQGRKALEDQARGDRQPGDPAAAFGRALRHLPEKQPGDRTDRESAAKQVNRDNRRDGQQGQESKRRRKDHAASRTPLPPVSSPRPEWASRRRRRAKRAPVARGARQAESQTAETCAIGVNRGLVDHEIELAVSFDIDESPRRIRLCFILERELDQREHGAIAREPRNEDVGVVRKQEVADDDAQRAAPKRQVRVFERGMAAVARDQALDVFGDVQRLRLCRRARDDA